MAAKAKQIANRIYGTNFVLRTCARNDLKQTDYSIAKALGTHLIINKLHLENKSKFAGSAKAHGHFKINQYSYS